MYRYNTIKVISFILLFSVLVIYTIFVLFQFIQNIRYQEYSDEETYTIVNKKDYTFPIRINNIINYEKKYIVFIYDKEYNMEIKLEVNENIYNKIYSNKTKVKVLRKIYRNKDNKIRDFNYKFEEILS